MVEGRDAEPLSDSGANALVYWYASFALLLGLQLVMSIMVVRFGGPPSYDEWTNGNGLIPSAAFLVLALGVPIALVWGALALYRVSANPCPWDPAFQNLAAKRLVYAGLVCVVTDSAQVAFFLSSLHLPALWQRLGFIACLIAVDVVLVWWVRRASQSGRLHIRLGRVRQIK